MQASSLSTLSIKGLYLQHKTFFATLFILIVVVLLLLAVKMLSDTKKK